MRIFTEVTGLEVSDQSNPLQVEDDETKSYSRLISVTRAATAGVVGAVLKNTAGTGFARLQLDANGSTGLVRLEAASAGGCTLDAPNQEIWLQNRTSGAALVVETDSDVTVNYGFNNLSDTKVKENIRDADLGELPAIFDAATPKRYDRVDVAHKDHRQDATRRTGIADLGLQQAHSCAVGRLQKPPEQNRGAREKT